MSEFKFACPVCGQHITADSGTSGKQIECPTCFQEIVVPQAPAAGDSKFILSAAQVGKPRPMPSGTGADVPAGQRSARSRSSLTTVALVVVVLGVGAGLFAFREQIFKPRSDPTRKKLPTGQEGQTAAELAQAGGASTNWTLELGNAVFPEGPARGSIHGRDFVCERAVLEGGTLALRQGQGWPPPLGIVIVLPRRPTEEWSGQQVEVSPGQAPPRPRVILRWTDPQQPRPPKQEIRGGYALKLAFGQAANGRMPGKIYICLADESRSYVAGAFEAEMRKAVPRQPRRPRPQP